jgi:hypothetical protein
MDYMSLHYPFVLKKSQYPLLGKIERKIRNLSSDLGIPARPTLKKICANTAFINSFFLHFAGCGADMELVNTELKSWRNLL